MRGKKKPTPQRARGQGNRQCAFPDCGRPAYAKGFCQTHHRQKRSGRPMTAIRPYRERRAGTTKFAGLRLSEPCAQEIQEIADEYGLSRNAAIEEILEGWFRKGRKH